MPIEKTLSIIKPDATRRNLTGAINKKIEDAGFKIVAQKRIHLTLNQAQKFYQVHRERTFFDDLCRMMISGPVVVQVLEKDDAVSTYRTIMGATNPENAEAGTIRNDYAESIEENSVHGSDSLENANSEIRFFFSEIEIIG